MKVIINRFRWLYAGTLIGFSIAAWALGKESENKKETTNPYNFNTYKHNHNKETTNA